MSASPHFICFGAAHWDVIARADPGPSTIDSPGRVEERPGGVAANVAIGLARRGCKVSLIAAVGDDADGERLGARLAAEGVDVSRLLRFVQAQTGRYVAIERSDGELRAAIADLGALELTDPAHLDFDALTGADSWFMETNLPASVLRAICLAPGRPPLYADAVSEARAPKLRGHLARLDGIYCNRAEAEAICATGLNAARAAAEALVMRGARRAVVTNGPLPAADAGAHGCEILQPAHRPVRSVTGAGDALIAAHLAAMATGAGARDALEKGLCAAMEQAA